MVRLKFKLLTWTMSVVVLIWFMVSYFSEPPDCAYDLDDNYYYESREDAPSVEKSRKVNLYLSEIQPPETNYKSNRVRNRSVYGYNHRMPITFIGGIAGSGIELLRELINQDSSQIRCGPETQLLTAIIEKNVEWSNIRLEKERLKHAGMTPEVIDSAIAQFILQVLIRHEPATPHVCNKDIYVFKWATYLKKLFPNAKFILVVRDPRATVANLFKRNFNYQGIRINSFANALTDWNLIGSLYHKSCVDLAKESGSCMVVLYEQLVINTNQTLNEIFRFLDIEPVYREYSFTDRRNGIDTVLNKVLLKRERLFSWLNDFPKNLVYTADKFAPLMTRLGYDTSKILPNKLAYSFNTTG